MRTRAIFLWNLCPEIISDRIVSPKIDREPKCSGRGGNPCVRYVSTCI